MRRSEVPLPSRYSRYLNWPHSSYGYWRLTSRLGCIFARRGYSCRTLKPASVNALSAGISDEYLFPNQWTCSRLSGQRYLELVAWISEVALLLIHRGMAITCPS
eukprot:4822456-Pleurochrysis_carterae.AAC.3